MVAWLREAGPPGERAQAQTASAPRVLHFLPAGEGARGALPSACVLHDLWPQSEVRESLGEEVSKGMDSRAEVCGASHMHRSLLPGPGWRNFLILSVVLKGKSHLIEN